MSNTKGKAKLCIVCGVTIEEGYRSDGYLAGVCVDCRQETTWTDDDIAFVQDMVYSKWL